jgi:hypothetical protein
MGIPEKTLMGRKFQASRVRTWSEARGMDDFKWLTKGVGVPPNTVALAHLDLF